MKTLYRIYIDSYAGLSRAAWLLAMVMLINRTGAMVLPFLGIYMSKKLGFSIEEIGIVLGCFGVGAMAGSWFGGWLTDRFGNFWVQSLSLFISVPLFIIIPNFQTVESLAAIIFILSLVTESFRPANSVSVARYAKPENITRAFSLNRMAVNLGFSIGPAMGGILATISYDWIFFGNAIGATFAGIVFMLFFFKKRTSVRETKAERKKNIDDLTIRTPYKDWKFHGFNLLCAIYAICFFQLLSTLPLFYQHDFSLNEKQIGMILASNGIVVVIFEMFLVHISEKRLNYASTIAIGTFLCAIGFLLLQIPGGVWVLYISMFFLSISEILAMPFMSSVVIKRAPLQAQGAYMGLNSLAFSTAHIFSPFLGTRIASNWSYQTLWLSTSVVLFLICFGFYYLIKKM